MSRLTFVICLFAAAFVALAAGCPASDREALLAFKASLNEPYLGIFQTWSGTDCCRN
ncbi:hypothetical protein CRG98_047938, partial [Punica granatum]